MNNKYLMIGFTSLSLMIASCGGIPYRIDVNQGNVISADSLEQLSLGMTKEEVQMTIGLPLLNDIFHRDRWDYVQYLKSGRTKEITEGVVSLYFVNGLLRQIDAEKITEVNEGSLSYGTLAQERAIGLDKLGKEVIIGPGKE